MGRSRLLFLLPLLAGLFVMHGATPAPLGMAADHGMQMAPAVHLMTEVGSATADFSDHAMSHPCVAVLGGSVLLLLLLAMPRPRRNTGQHPWSRVPATPWLARDGPPRIERSLSVWRL